MSRPQHSAGVDAPRPRAALIMAATANAALAVTGEVAGWALALAGAVLGYCFLRRTRPARWQRSPVVLNLALAPAILVPLTIFTRGQPLTVALAHLALLAQGLQLLDARPRRSEFLLVALSLLQVVLASNLTDSVFFPLLLICFLVATTWTLLLHTLRLEAIEAGDPRAASRAATPGLMRAVVISSLLSAMLALTLFPLLPRMRTAVFRGGELGAGLAISGFSDQVELGDLGRIRSDSSVVLRVETTGGEPPGPEHAYWQGLAFDHFDGRRWSISPSRRARVPGLASRGIDLDPGGPRADLVQRVVREPVAAGVLFGVGRPRRITGALHRVERDSNGGLYVPSQADARIGYVIATRRPIASGDELLDDAVAAPDGDRRFLQIPLRSDRIPRLARRVTAGAARDADRLRMLESYLVRNGRYSDTPPRLSERDPRSPVEAFLDGGLAGHCEYFATAMVLMARSLGLSARLVNGFAGGRRNPLGGFVTLTRADAHAWVEVHFRRHGWVRYDPTPADLRRAAAEAAGGSWGRRALEVADALELWWFQRVVEFDGSDQARALRLAWLKWGQLRGVGGNARRSGGEREQPGDVLEPSALLVAFAALAAIALGARLGRRRPGAAPIPAPYAAALRLLARRGLLRASATAPRAYARQVAARLPPAGAAAFRELTEAYLAQRFGGRPQSGTRSELRALRDSLRA